MSRRVISWTCLTLALGIGTGSTASPGRAAEFQIRPDGGSKVVFLSKATMESFKGKTTRVEGRVVVDPASLGDSVTVDVEVDLASLDTGIRKRNQDMRENHLETAKYPKAVFHGVTVRGPAGAALESGKSVTLDLEGTFTIHGVSRRLRAPVRVVYEPKGAGGRIRFETTFPVSLADYNISRPQFLFLKLADVQQVTVTGVAEAR
jgi:polyisoprenoid-binding protein YceI